MSPLSSTINLLGAGLFIRTTFPPHYVNNAEETLEGKRFCELTNGEHYCNIRFIFTIVYGFMYF